MYKLVTFYFLDSICPTHAAEQCFFLCLCAAHDFLLVSARFARATRATREKRDESGGQINWERPRRRLHRPSARGTRFSSFDLWTRASTIFIKRGTFFCYVIRPSPVNSKISLFLSGKCRLLLESSRSLYISSSHRSRSQLICDLLCYCGKISSLVRLQKWWRTHYLFWSIIKSEWVIIKRVFWWRSSLSIWRFKIYTISGNCSRYEYKLESFIKSSILLS
jgi:hypothetical protein